MSALPEPILAQILTYLDLSPDSSGPRDPLVLLRAALPRLPHTLLAAFDGPTSPRERAAIPEIKARRIAWANGPASLSGVGPRADETRGRAPRRVLRWRAGRRRWPALWERMGGPGDSSEVRRWEEEMGEAEEDSEGESDDEQDDEAFAERSFIPGQETVHHAPAIPTPNQDAASSSSSSSAVLPNTLLAAPAAQPHTTARSGMNTTMHRRRFGAFLRSLEEERAGEEDARARRAEREFDRREEAAKEEFEDSESEEEDANGPARGRENGADERGKSREEMERVIEAFEKRLLELFLDGLDTIPYGPIDFADPARLPPNKLTAQDAEDRYFDDEEAGQAPALDARAVELRLPNGKGVAEGLSPVSPAREGALAEGEYDY